MGKRGRKQDFTTEESRRLKQILYEEYDRLMSAEREANKVRARFLQRAYYAEIIHEMNIVPWTLEYIERLLTDRARYDNKRG
jgi:hypothetical protein